MEWIPAFAGMTWVGIGMELGGDGYGMDSRLRGNDMGGDGACFALTVGAKGAPGDTNISEAALKVMRLTVGV